MAITYVSYQLLKEHAHLLKRGGALLEIGEANWYGDMSAEEVKRDAELGSMYYVLKGGDLCSANLFEVAKAVYAVLFEPQVIDAVDINGTDKAFKLNLNEPLKLPRKWRTYDTIINHGTAEHVFNIAQVFKTMHDACAVGGVMIHDAPFTGWIDHGFYLMQPTLFYDIAAANDYELISMSMTHFQSRTIKRIETREQWHTVNDIPWNAMLFCVLRKTKDAPFRIPMQAIYGGGLSESGNQAWHNRR